MRFARTACFCLCFLAACDVYHPEAFDDYDAGFDASLPDAGGRDAALPDAAPSDGGLDAGQDAGFDAGHDAGVDGGFVCEPRHPPARGPGPGRDGLRIVYALHEIVLDQGGSVWNDVGYDLDDTCTTGTDTTTCEARGGASPQIDGDDGVDNAAGREILTTLTITNPGLEARARMLQDEGDNALLLVVEGWDGADDDAIVTAWLGQTIYGTPEGGVRGDPLAWDGTDSFVVSAADFVDGDPTQPLIVDDAAYVTGRTLVMSLPEGRPIYFPWEENPMTLRLTDAFITAEFDPTGTTITAARLTGRWALLDISASLTQIGVCPGDGDRTTIDTLVQRVADVRGDPSTDAMGLPCDAVSAALEFTGVEARFDGVATAPPLTDLCTP